MVYKTFFQSLAFLLYIINLFFLQCTRDTVSWPVCSISRQGWGNMGRGRQWLTFKKTETWALFPCNQWTCSYHRSSLLFVVSSLRYWSQLECTLEITEKHFYYLHGSTPHYHQSKIGWSNWWENSDRSGEMFLKYKCVGGLLALYSYAL